MNQQLKNRRFVSVLLAALLVVTMFVSMAPPVIAANRRFITELRVESGEEAVAKLEAEGWSVTMVGLNVTADPAAQVYLAYNSCIGLFRRNNSIDHRCGGCARCQLMCQQ